MAQSKPYNHKDLTKCGICLSTQQEPKSLPCLHSYCLECLTRWARGKAKVSCPICTQEFDIPSGGVRAFRTSFFINTLKERQATVLTLQSRDAVVPCLSCGGVDEKVEGYCCSCGGFICGGCVIMHSKLKGLGSHKIIPYDDLKSGKVDIRSLSQKKYCTIHSDQVLWFYCESCGVLTCRDCTVVDHPSSNHSLVNLETASKEHKKEIEQLIQRAQGVKERTRSRMKEITYATDMLDKDVTKAKNKIDESFKKAQKLLEENRNQLKTEVDRAAANAKKQIDSQLGETQLFAARISTALQMATEVINTGSDYDLALVYTSLKTNLTDLGDLKLAHADIEKANIQFTSAQIGTGTAQKLGSVDVKVKKRKEGAGVWKLERKFGDTGSENLKFGRGVAVTRQECVAVADYNDKSIKVYHKNGTHKFTIPVPGAPYNVVASADGRFYVASMKQVIYVYDERGSLQYEVSTKSPSNMSSDAQTTRHFGLALDNSETLLAGEDNYKYISKHKLDGTHIMSFKTTISPQCIAVTQENHIIVSAGDSADRAVQILDVNGSLLHSLSLSSPSYNIYPRGMCCTSDDQVFISNYKSYGSIEYFSTKTGAYIGCVTKDAKFPAGLTLMGDEEKLVVVEDYCIKIFEMQH